MPRLAEEEYKNIQALKGARKMIAMMMAINKENFESHREVTCYSCHRGSPDPVATPIISADEPN